MSVRGLVPVALAVGLGIANGERDKEHLYPLDETDTENLGYVIFNPAFQQREVEKIRQQR